MVHFEKVLSGLVYQNFDFVRPAIKKIDFVIWRRRRNCLRPKSVAPKSVFFIFWLPEAKFHRTNFHQMTAPPMRKDP